MPGLRLAFTFFCIVVSIIAFGQCGLVPLSVEQKTKSAAHIAKVKILTDTTYVGDKGYVYTVYNARVRAWAKGSSRTEVVQIEIIGGIHSNRATTVSGSVSLAAGKEYLLFLSHGNTRRLRTGLLPRYNLISQSQGAVPLTNSIYIDPATGEKTPEQHLFSRIANSTGAAARRPDGSVYQPAINTAAQQPLAIQSISSFTMGANVSGSVNAADHLRIYGSGFGNTVDRVWFTDANSGGADTIHVTTASDYVAWNDSYIEVKIPARAGTGNFGVRAGTNTYTSATPITINGAFLNIYTSFLNYPAITRHRPLHLDQNNSGGYSFRYNNNFAAVSAATVSMDRALISWRCATGLNFSMASGSVSTEAANDGNNIIQFETAATPLSLGVLGVAITNYSGAGAPGVCEQQNTVWFIRDMDIIFSDPPYTGYTWQYGAANPTGSQFDFESVALHELGHAHGLGHVISPGAVMHWQMANGQVARTLSTQDVATGQNMMAHASTACGIPSGYYGVMTNASCVLPVNFTQFEGRKHNNENVLSWSTSDEKENRGFYIERSASGNDFKSIGFVIGKNSTTASYQFTDAAPGQRTWRYRLKQVDHNGRNRVSSVVQIEGSASSSFAIWSSGREVQVQTATAGRLQLLAPDGRLLVEKRLTPGQSSIILPQNINAVLHYRFNSTHSGKLFIQ